jgi:pseudaminic acid cytidylyltransferase
LNNLAVIPARGGSKRIHKKNIKLFDGRPMIAYAITAAVSSGLFEHVIVSTDDDEIATLAKAGGVEVPFIRPKELADDHTPTVPVIAHAIEECRKLGWEFENVCCIYPAAPFVQVEDIKTALEMLTNQQAPYCFPITEFPSAIQRAMKRLHRGRMEPFYPEHELTRTQDLDRAYHDAGQFYWGHVDAWLNNPKIHSNGIGHIIPNWRVTDIDTLEDWERAEVLFQVMAENERRARRILGR